jgi:hypothetical protein
MQRAFSAALENCRVLCFHLKICHMEIYPKAQAFLKLTRLVLYLSRSLHEVLNEPERDQVIADIVRWLDAH